LVIESGITFNVKGGN